jgi:hypothetical protein
MRYHPGNAGRSVLLSTILIVGLFVPAGASHAQTANTITATCKDGTPYSGTTRSGACRGHGGVKTWGPAPAVVGPSATPSQPASPAAQGTPTPTGTGQVWVNTASKVYHCPGDRWYGKTKKGAYMSEAQAKAEGARADHGKACGS